MRKLNAVAVFCGSNFGAGDGYREAATRLGAALARRGHMLVYGGTHKGLMGTVADAVLAGGGAVHGVITRRLVERGHLHPGLTHHDVVPDMRSRKAAMAVLADAFIALPGGIGTMEEFMEVWTLNQLGDIEKPAGLLNAGGYFDRFVDFVRHMVDERFLPREHLESLPCESDPDVLLDALAAYRSPSASKWMS